MDTISCFFSTPTWVLSLHGLCRANRAPSLQVDIHSEQLLCIGESHGWGPSNLTDDQVRSLCPQSLECKHASLNAPACIWAHAYEDG